MKYSLGLSSSFISWLGSAYGQTLRLTAVACLVSGSVLVRCGLARPDVSSVSGRSQALRLLEETACATESSFPSGERL